MLYATFCVLHRIFRGKFAEEVLEFIAFQFLDKVKKD
jgi:hypothetical protein